MSSVIDQARLMESQARVAIHEHNLDQAAAILREAIKILEDAYDSADAAEKQLIDQELAVLVGLLGST